MLYAGLDRSRQRLDAHVLDEEGGTVEVIAIRPDADALRTLAGRYEAPVSAVVESMNGARFVHDELERHGWDVAVADGRKTEGLAPLTAKTDKVDARVLAELCRRELVPAIWLPDPGSFLRSPHRWIASNSAARAGRSRGRRSGPSAGSRNVVSPITSS